MCSINGFISFNETISISTKQRIKQTIINSEERGKDSFGYITINGNNDIFEYKYIDKPSNILQSEFNLPDDTKILLNNNRAEPTTEYIQNKKLSDTQPYYSNNCIAIHNGTISNDKQLIDKYNLKLDTEIDSAVIPWLFDNIGKYDYKSAIKVLTDELIGSYATCIYNIQTHTIYLATNYKPLYIAYDNNGNILYFTSFIDYMINTKNYNTIFDNISYKEVLPYTLLVIHTDIKDIKSFSLYKSDYQLSNINKKSIILASAGLDSTVAIAWSIKQGYDTSLLHFNYKCKADEKEKKHIKLISEYYNIPLISIDADFIKNINGNSNLFDNIDINTNRGGIDGAELAIEWVPARNLIFFSIAAGYAEAHNIDYIILGGNLEESGAYSDNELIFQKKFNDILPNSLNLQHKVEVLTPIANYMKKDIVKLGLELNAPLHLTWSCYENGDFHCGKCAPCYMRRTAFKMLQQTDNITYKN